MSENTACIMCSSYMCMTIPSTLNPLSFWTSSAAFSDYRLGLDRPSIKTCLVSTLSTQGKDFERMRYSMKALFKKGQLVK